MCESTVRAVGLNTLAFAFVQPALLLGLAAAVAPLLLHWLLRPRPRRVIFPAATLFQRALASGQRSRRLQDYRLLLVRVLLLSLLAIGLAGPSCDAPRPAALSEGPKAVAILLDDSWSTSYHPSADASLLDELRDSGLKELRTLADDPDAVAFGFVRLLGDRSDVELTTDRAVVRASLERVGADPPHAATLADGLQRALRMLQTARQPRRELIVLTDGAAHAWRDLPGGLLSRVDNTRVRVLTPPPAPRTNLALLGVSLDAGEAHESSPLSLATSLRSSGIAATASLLVRVDGREAARLSPISLAADTTLDASLIVPPLPLGRHALSIELEPTDRMNADQVRYAVVNVAPRPRAWLVTADDAPEPDLATVIVRNLLAPETLPDAGQTVDLRVWRAADLGSSVADAAPNLIVVPSGVNLADSAVRFVQRQIESGAVLLLLAGTESRALDWPGLRSLFSTRSPRVEDNPPPLALAWEGAGPEPRNEGLSELTRTDVRRRVRLDDRVEGVDAVAHFGDSEPALLQRRIGRGRAVLLTTSPDPMWSDLGVRAAGLLEYMHLLMVGGTARDDTRAGVPAGATLAKPPVDVGERTSCTVQRVAPPDGKSTAIRVTSSRADPPWPTGTPGVYAVRAAGSDGPVGLYAVNWPAEESDLRPIEQGRLRQLLGTENVTLESTDTPQETDTKSTASRRWIDPTYAAALMLLALLIGELFLAGRSK